MDTLQLTIMIVLIAAVTTSFLILLRWGWDFVESNRRIGMHTNFDFVNESKRMSYV